MARGYDRLETRGKRVREREQMAGLADAIAVLSRKRLWRKRFAGVDAAELRHWRDLAAIPVLRKEALKQLQAENRPFAELVPGDLSGVAHLFTSPGPIYEPEGADPDWWGTARAMYAAGIRKGDVVLNTFAYHLTPGGFILDAGARALGCPVIPAGPGAKETQLELIEHYRPRAYVGTPDFLKILLDAARELGRDASSIEVALVTGAALPGSLRAELEGRGVKVRQCYAIADVGLVAYETDAPDGSVNPGMVVDERIVLEIVRPGSSDPVAAGEVGEVVVSRADAVHPVIRLGTGDLSALMIEASPCGRTGPRIRGWMGRADQKAKVKGMFVDPADVDRVVKRHPEIRLARLVVTREKEQDAMELRVETEVEIDALLPKIAATLQAVTKLKGVVTRVAPGSLPRDGKVIVDERPVG
ncbi:MAG: AMP-binding protein [Hyphomicrobiales bacterium]|nr:AMP-binding protein [Hyphomicrobiales bacterium]